jgi:hypothetical protein
VTFRSTVPHAPKHIETPSGVKQPPKDSLTPLTVPLYSTPEAVTTNLARAADQLDIVADHIGTLFAAARDISDIVSHEQ